MKRSQYAAAGVVAGLLVVSIGVISIDPPVYSADSGHHQLPDSVGTFIADRVLFCQNDQCLESLTVSDLGEMRVCPKCDGELKPVSLAELTKLPEDVEIQKRQYRGKGNSYSVSSVRSGYSRAGIHRPEVCLEAQGYRIVGSRVHRVKAASGATFDVTFLRAVHGSGRAAHYAYWFRSGEFETASHTTRILKMGWDGVIRNTRQAWVYFAIVAQAGGTASEQHEIDELHEFLGLLHDGIKATTADQ